MSVDLDLLRDQLREVEAEASARGLSFAAQAKFADTRRALSILEMAREKNQVGHAR